MNISTPCGIKAKKPISDSPGWHVMPTEVEQVSMSSIQSLSVGGSKILDGSGASPAQQARAIELKAKGERLRAAQRYSQTQYASPPKPSRSEVSDSRYHDEAFEELDASGLPEETSPEFIRSICPKTMDGLNPELSMHQTCPELSMGDLAAQSYVSYEAPHSIDSLDVEQTATVEATKTTPLTESPTESINTVANATEAVKNGPLEVLGMEKLSQLWCEQEFLLRKPVKSNADIKEVAATARAGLGFLTEIEAAARELGLLRGAVSRAVLPFNTETSVKDQADTGDEITEGAFGIGAQLGAHRWKRMVKDATAVRSLVRVKIADDADLDQAAAALNATVDFFDALAVKSQVEGKDEYELLQQL